MTLQLAIKITADAAGAKAGAAETQQAYERLDRGLQQTGRAAGETAAALRRIGTEGRPALDVVNLAVERANRGARELTTSLAGVARASRQAAVDAAVGVRADFGGAARAADIAAYGAAMDNLRAKYSPLYVAQQQHRQVVEEINQALRVGAISFDEHAAALRRAEGAYQAQIAKVRQLDGALAAQAATAKAAAQAMVARQTTTPDRGADIAAYGAALDELRARYSPLFAAEQQHRQVVEEVNQALRVGAISLDEHAAALRRAEGAYQAQIAKVRQLDGALAAQAATAKAAAQATVARQTITPDRGADIAAYGAALDELRARYSPLFAAQRSYVAQLAEIRQAEKVGALSAREAAAAVERTKAAFAGQVTAIRGARSEVTALTGQLQGWQRQQLMAQGFDVFTSLSSGMNPLVVAAQQGPQVIQVYGGLRQAMQAALAVFTPLRIAAGGLTGAVIAGAVAWSDYLASTKEVATANAGLGRNIGASTGELEAIAQSAGAAAGVSVRQARTMEAAFLRTGRVGKESFEGLISISKDFAATLVTDLDTASGKLAEIFADPGRGAQQLQQLGLMDGATARLVTRLAAQNETTRAQSILLTALKGRLADAAEATTAWARAWAVVSTAASNAADAVGRALDRQLGGSAPSLQEQLAQARREMDQMLARQALRARNPYAYIAGPTEEELRQQQARIEDLQEQLRAQSRLDTHRREQAQDDRASSGAIAAAAASPVNAQMRERIELEQRLRDLQAGAGKAGQTPEEQQQIADAIEATTRALAGLASARQRQVEIDRLDVQIQEARDPLVKADLVARREQLRLAGEQITAGQAAIQVERARQKSLEESAAASRQAARSILDGQRAQIEQLQLEISLVGKSAAERSRMTAALEAEQRIREANISSSSAEAEAIRRSAQAVAAYTTELERRKDAFATFQRAGETAFDALGDALAGKKVDFASVMQDIQRQMIQLAVINPLKNMALGTNYGTMTDLFSVFSGGGGAKAVGAMTVTAGTVIVNGGVGGIPGLPGAAGATTSPLGAGGIGSDAAAAARAASAAAAVGAGGLASLTSSRSQFSTELADPDVVRRLYAITNAEVGGQGPQAQQAFLESVFNRADSRDMSLMQTISDRKYFPAETFRNADRYMGQDLSGKYGSILDQVKGGSNISNYATGNASGTVGFAGGPQTFASGGERFGIEGPDRAWAAQMQQFQTSLGGATNATQNFSQGLGGTASELAKATQSTAQAAGGMGSAATELTQAGQTTATAAAGFSGDFSSALNGLLSALTKGLGGLFGFANGGIMTGTGPMPLRTYSTGGIADRPQLALFGEGAQNEAFVPLPDGRRIPVALSLRGAGNDNSGSAFAAATRLNAAAEKLSAAAGGGGSRGKTEVHLHGGGADNAEVEERQDADGNTRLDVYLDTQVAKAVSRPGSQTRAAMSRAGRAKRR